jgi:hypothetical protein
MQLNIRQTLHIFDEKPSEANGHVTAIVSMVGEELNAELFKHYLIHERNATNVHILNDPVLPGTRKGQRLDRWIMADVSGERRAYQCEIKNWSSWAIGGKVLPTGAPDTEILHVAQYHWERERRSNLAPADTPSRVLKALLAMKLPHEAEGRVVAPCVIYWMPFAPTQHDMPYFAVPVSELHVGFDTPFQNGLLHFFSASLYLRLLLKKGIETVDIDIPFLEIRQELISSIIGDI